MAVQTEAITWWSSLHTKERGRRIARTTSDGATSTVTWFLESPFNDYKPITSPDGTMIAFFRVTNEADKETGDVSMWRSKICVMNVNGSNLRELTGDPTFSITSILSYDPAIHHPDQEGLLEQALAFDPKRRKLNADILVAAADVQVRKSAIFPQLNAQYEKPTFGPDRVGVVLRAQTDGGLSRFSAVSVARERQASAEIALLSNERELREQIEVDELENAVAKDRAASSAISATSATAVTESFMRQFVAGRRTWFDVMNAVRESMTARISEVDARISAMASASRLLMRSGRWTPQAQKDQGQ